MKDYQLRVQSCVLLERGRLEKKGIGTEQAEKLASHNVNKTLWILRNRACLGKIQALEVLEDRQVQKRSRKKIVFFWTNKEYFSELVYTPALEDRIIVKEAIKNYFSSGKSKRQSYLWYARQAKKLEMKPRELIELVNRWKQEL